MSNLKAARTAIEAEIVHAKSVMDYYMSRVSALEQTLAGLKSLGEQHAVASTKSSAPPAKPPVKQLPIAKATKPGKPAKKQKPGRAKAGANRKQVAALPFTGGDYWPNLLSDQPQHTSEIMKAAIAGLGFAPTPVQVKQLMGRMTFSLNTLVKQKRIQDSGAGRDRRFFKK
jgi:hypothetical protein